MNANCFDALARRLTRQASRRGALAGLAGGLVMVGPLVLGGREAGAKKKRKHKKRRKRNTSCQAGMETCLGQCVDLCPGGQVRNPVTCGCCQVNGGTCSPTGANADCCSGSCASVSTVVNTCAGRNVAQPCDFDAQCASGACSPTGQCVFAAQ